MKDKSVSRIVAATKLSIPMNAVVAVGKIIFGIFTGSFFMLLNAFYSIGIAVSKGLAIALPSDKTIGKTGTDAAASADTNIAADKAEGEAPDRSNFYIIGIIIMASSLSYVLYSVTLFFKVSSIEYPNIMGIALALVSFVDIFIAVKGSVSARRSKVVRVEAIKLINVASTLISFVFTQTALMSFAFSGAPEILSVANGLSGVVFGALACAVGLYMIVYTALCARRTRQILQKRNEISEIEKTAVI